MTYTYQELARSLFLEDSPDDIKMRGHKARQMGLMHLGGGYYGKTQNDPATHKADGRNIVPLTPEEKEDADKTTSGFKKGSRRKSAPPLDNFRATKLSGEPKQAPEKATTYNKVDFAAQLQTRMEMVTSVFNSSPQAKSQEKVFKPEFERFYERLTNISMLPPGKVRHARLEKFIGDYGLAVGNNMIYSNYFPNTGGLYRVFGKYLGNDGKYFLQMATEEGIDVPESYSRADSSKFYVSGQSKPKFTTIHDTRDKTVKEIFSNSPMNQLPPMYQKVYGPSDELGNLIKGGGTNAKKHFEYSVNNNTHIDATIDSLIHLSQQTNQAAEDDTGFIGVAKAFQRHKEHMKNVVREFDSMTPPAREIYVGQIYAKLAYDMHMADVGLAGSIMKNLAEHALYDTEVAAGHEVYMPSEATFPVGDKIVVKRKEVNIEHVETVSVKFGKNSTRSYGMPSEAAKIMFYHPDKTFHDILDSRIGRSGYEVGVAGRVINDSSTFGYMARTSEFSECFTLEQLEEIRSVAVETTFFLKSFKQGRSHGTSNDVTIRELGNVQMKPEFQMLTKKMYDIIHNSANHTKLEELMGKDNYKLMMQKNSNIFSFYSMMVFSAALKTSNGFSTVLHNHQEYKDGRLFSQTDTGTMSLPDWHMQWHPFGERGGGLKMGFNKVTESANERII